MAGNGIINQKNISREKNTVRISQSSPFKTKIIAPSFFQLRKVTVMQLLLLLVSISSSSAIPLAIYNNARFQSNMFNWLWRNFSGLISRDQCACQCHFDQWCLTASYSATDQLCSMFSVQLYDGQMYSVAISEQSSVLIFTNKTLPRK